MDAHTVQKARLFDLFACVGDLVRSGKRDPDHVAMFLQYIKDHPNFISLFVRQTHFPVWMTLRVSHDIIVSAKIFFQESLRHSLSYSALHILTILTNEFLPKDAEVEFDLVLFRVSDLGFNEGACYSEICERVAELGLELCPAIVGLLVRQLYTDQLRYEHILVAMKAVLGINGDKELFDVMCRGDGFLHLTTNYGASDHYWDKYTKFVFVHPRNAGAVASMVAVLEKYKIDCDAAPFLPEGRTVEEHQKGGQMEWDKKAQAKALYLSENQKDGKIIGGEDLRKELAGKPVLNANVLDFLLKHPELIPEEWKGKKVFFWGTIYRYPDDRLNVRYLRWSGSRWEGGDRSLGSGWSEANSASPAAVRAMP